MPRKILKPARIRLPAESADKKYLFLHFWRMLTREPEPVREFVFAPPRKFKFDLAWPAANERVAVEVDGGDHLVKYSPKTGQYHAVGRHTKDADKIKRNLATELGWRVFHYSPKMITDDPHGVVYQVLRTLERLREGKFDGR